MLGTALAPLAAATFGLSVILVRKGLCHSSVSNAVFIVNLIGNVILWPIALLFSDLRVANMEAVLLFAVAGILAPGIARLLLYKGMTILNVSINSVVFGIYPIYSSLLAVSLLGEKLSILDWTGIIFIVAGIGFIGRSSKADNTSKRKLAKAKLILPVLAGLIVALSHIVRKSGLNIYDAPILGVSIGFASSFPIYLTLQILNRNSQPILSFKENVRIFWKVGVVLTVGWLLSYYAFSYGKVSIVSALIQTEPCFVIIFSHLFLKESERISPGVILNAFIIVLGVAFIVI